MHGIYYSKIDEIPLYNWIKCLNGNVEYVRKKRGIKYVNSLDVLAFEALYDDFIQVRGLGKDYLSLLDLKLKLAEKQRKFIESWNARLLNDINIMSARVIEIETRNKKESITIEQSLVYLGKWLGYHLNSREITALDYYLLLEEYGRGNKEG